MRDDRNCYCKYIAPPQEQKAPFSFRLCCSPLALALSCWLQRVAPPRAFAMERQHGVPIRSNLQPPQENFRVADRLRTHDARGGGDGEGQLLFSNTPMLPKNRAIRYFQSEPNAPLVRAEIERHVDVGGTSGGDPADDDTIDSIDLSNFQNAHLAARIVAEQTQRRLQRQRELLQQQQQFDCQRSSGVGSGGYPHADLVVGAARPSAVNFSPRPKNSELGQQIKKLASASLAARQALSQGISLAAGDAPPAAHRNSKRGSGGGGSGDGSGGGGGGMQSSKAAAVAGPAFHLQEQVKALAKRRAQARKSGAEHERSLARQQASNRAEDLAEARVTEEERRAAEQRQRQRTQEERRTVRKERVRARVRARSCVGLRHFGRCGDGVAISTNNHQRDASTTSRRAGWLAACGCLTQSPSYPWLPRCCPFAKDCAGRSAENRPTGNRNNNKKKQPL